MGLAQIIMSDNTITSADERDLIELARRDVETFQKLYRWYSPRVYAYIAFRVRNKQDAEDIVAETFLRVVENLHQFEYRGEGSFAAWVFCIARNCLGQFYRTQHSRGSPLSLDELPDQPSDAPTPVEAATRHELRAQLQKAIAGLSSRKQEIITLKFFGGLRNKEIAEILGLNERTVASHLCQAIADLRRACPIKLGEEEE